MASTRTTWPIEPMLAKAVSSLPERDDLQFEPKWDGFRAVVAVAADGSVEIGSRGGKPLTRYFPELVAVLAASVPAPAVLDGEIVVRSGRTGAERLDWEALSARIHPAESRIAALSVDTPASFVAFDLLEDPSGPLLDRPLLERRDALVALLADARPPVHVSQATRDRAVALRWLAEFEGAGLDGVVAKPVDGRYEPGRRTMLKLKHVRTADVVLTGYRLRTGGGGVGSLLLGLHDAAGRLQPVGGASAFTAARRLELVDELDEVVVREADGTPATGERERNRFSSARDTSFVPLRPERVLEVRYDQMEGSQFRHTVQFVRWRPDRDPESCGFDQLESPAAYDLAEVLA